MNAFELHQQLAWELAAGNPYLSAEEHWRNAAGVLVRQRAEALAKRNPSHSAEQNWLEAEQALRWDEWAACALRPYITEHAGDIAVFAEELSDVEQKIATGAVRWRAVVVRDGAREYARGKHRLHSGNCVDPKSVIESKDSVFFEVCAAVSELYDGWIADEGLTNGGPCQSGARRFQDGLPVCFPMESEGFQVMTWAFQIKRRLELYNERHRASWIDELHPRISIGFEWSHALAGLSGVRRGEIALEAGGVSELPADVRALLKVIGINVSWNSCEVAACMEQVGGERIGGGTHEGGRVLAGMARVR